MTNRLLPEGDEGQTIADRVTPVDYGVPTGGQGISTPTPASPPGTPPVEIPTGGEGIYVPEPADEQLETGRGIAGGYELWLVGSQYYVVYYVPTTEPPVPMAWQVRSDEDLQAIVGPGVPLSGIQPHQVMSTSEFMAQGAIPMGGATEILNTSEHPFETFLDTFEMEAAMRPWLRDPEILALTAGAILEGRSITDAELFSTTWWQTHTDAERAWLQLNAQNPAEAQRRIDDTKSIIASALRDAGMYDPPADLVSFLAGKQITGAWSTQDVGDQIIKLSDPAAPYDLNPELEQFTGLDTTRAQEDSVRRMIQEWLGPAFGSQYSSQFISDWAGRLRNDPDGSQHLTDLLRRARLSLFPMYENPEMRYEDIAGPWRQVFFSEWGGTADETDPIFTQLLQMNDLMAAKQHLRTEGLKRGNRTVVSGALDELQRSVRNPGIRQADRGVL